MSERKLNSKSIVVVGSVNADVVVEVPRLPVPGETLNASRPDTGVVFPGGKGANTAVAAARMAAQKGSVRFAGMFGHDSHASMLQAVMTEAGCDLKLSDKPADPNVPSGQAFIFLMDGGENSIVIVGGANHSWPDTLSPSLSEAVANAGVVMLQREVPEEVNLQVARVAKANDSFVFQDLGGKDGPLSPEMMQCLSLVAPNETELARLTGMPTDTTEQVITAALSLQRAGIREVLVTLGSKGSLYVSADGSVHKHGIFQAREVVDTTGAGDCFRGAFMVAFVEGKSIPECLDFAAAASSLAVATKGAMTSLPTRRAVLQVMAQGNKLPSKL